MAPKQFQKLSFFLVPFLVLGVMHVNAQTETSSVAGKNLFAEISRLDSVLFNAFNKRDTVAFKNLFSKDLEFYHDKGGLSGYEQTINFLRETIKTNSDMSRELVNGSLRVYAVPGYGALEIGEHRFCHTENGKKECGTFKFIHIWQKKNTDWMISRVISYNH